MEHSNKLFHLQSLYKAKYIFITMCLQCQANLQQERIILVVTITALHYILMGPGSISLPLIYCLNSILMNRSKIVGPSQSHSTHQIDYINDIKKEIKTQVRTFDMNLGLISSGYFRFHLSPNELLCEYGPFTIVCLKQALLLFFLMLALLRKSSFFFFFF